MTDCYDVIIIGAGPAGMSAAIYASRANLKTLIIEKDTPGGQLVKTKSIKNYPGYKEIDGPSLAYKMYEQANELPIQFEYDEVIEMTLQEDMKVVQTKTKQFLSKNVIVATGTSYKNLAVVGERKFIGRGISYCAVCDGKLYTDKNILVVGASNSALKESLYLAQFAKKIFMIHTREDFDDQTLYQSVLKQKNIALLAPYRLSKIIGDEDLQGVEVTNIKNNEIVELHVSGIFPFLGSTPSTSFLSSFDLFTANGYMEVNEHFESKITGLYGVGDVIQKELRQVVTACADGAIAAQHIANLKK